MREAFLGSGYFGLVLSLLLYYAAVLLKKRLRLAVLNPLLVSMLGLMLLLWLLRIPYEEYLSSAKLLSYLLTPATVCLAIPMYRQLHLLRENLTAVLLSILLGTLSSLFCIFMMAGLFRLSEEHLATLLPKSITTAIGMGVSQEAGGITALTVAAIILTGILGNVIAEPVFRIFRIKEPIARGLALGTSAHAVGTAKALELGEIEGAMSSLSIVVAGILTVILVPLVMTMV